MAAGWGAQSTCRYPWVGWALLGLITAAKAVDVEELFSMDLESLSRMPVETATRYSESASQVPAVVIVLTHEQLMQRGYRNLSEIYDDLPGMNVTRPYGDTYFKNYWRGLRRNVGSPYLVLIDGVVFNDLHYNEDEVLVAVPMSNIEQVEIVYGPASAVYGANAFAGVINIITRSDMPEGQSFDGQLRTGSNANHIADVTARYRRGDWRTSLSLRYDYGYMDNSHTQNYEWTKQQYYDDRSLWGGFLDNANYGRSHSPHQQEALDLRVQYRDTELAVQQWRMATGYGSEYPADQVQNYAWWQEPERSIYLRQRAHPMTDMDSTTLLRYRESSIAPASDFLEGYNVTDPGTTHTHRVLDYSYWDYHSKGWTAEQDLVWHMREDWLFAMGVNLEYQHLQKAYWTRFGPSLTPAQVPTFGSYPFPAPPSHDSIPNNYRDIREEGAYLATRYQLPHWQEADHALHLGVRYDDHTDYGSSVDVRAGVVSSRGPWVAKILYGQSFQEPPPRLLYGGWRGAGSDPNLKPERADTTEANVGYTLPEFSALISVYQVRGRDNITTFAGGARNLGGQVVNGADLHLNTLWNLSEMQLRAWGYYSYISTSETRPQLDGGFTDGPIGDIATHSVRAGFTADWGARWESTLRGRYVGRLQTVPTNPVGTLPGSTTFDLNLNHWLRKDLNLGLDVYNLFDHYYAEPGIRTADAGSTPGFYDSNGVWQGSAGAFSSLLPQEGRTLMLTLTYKH